MKKTHLFQEFNENILRRNSNSELFRRQAKSENKRETDRLICHRSVLYRHHKHHHSCLWKKFVRNKEVFTGDLTTSGVLSVYGITDAINSKAVQSSYCSESELFTGENHSPGPGRLVPSSHQRSELSNTILGTFSRGDKRVRLVLSPYTYISGVITAEPVK